MKYLSEFLETAISHLFLVFLLLISKRSSFEQIKTCNLEKFQQHLKALSYLKLLLYVFFVKKKIYMLPVTWRKIYSRIWLMYNGPSVNVTDGTCVQRCDLSMCCTFSNHFFELNFGLYSLHLHNNTKGTFFKHFEVVQ